MKVIFKIGDIFQSHIFNIKERPTEKYELYLPTNKLEFVDYDPSLLKVIKATFQFQGETRIIEDEQVKIYELCDIEKM